jgi:hypothetical protein
MRQKDKPLTTVARNSQLKPLALRHLAYRPNPCQATANPQHRTFLPQYVYFGVYSSSATKFRRSGPRALT